MLHYNSNIIYKLYTTLCMQDTATKNLERGSTDIRSLKCSITSIKSSTCQSWDFALCTDLPKR